MRTRLPCTALLLSSPVTSSFAQESAPVVSSPAVHADRRVAFPLYAPRAADGTPTRECIVKGRQAVQKNNAGLEGSPLAEVARDVIAWRTYLPEVAPPLCPPR